MRGRAKNKAARTGRATEKRLIKRLAENIQKLPQELFDKIYKFTFTADPCIRYVNADLRAPSILRIDRTSRELAAQSYYGNTTFVVEVDQRSPRLPPAFVKWLNSMPTEHRKMLREVRLMRQRLYRMKLKLRPAHKVKWLDLSEGGIDDNLHRVPLSRDLVSRDVNRDALLFEGLFKHHLCRGWVAARLRWNSKGDCTLRTHVTIVANQWRRSRCLRSRYENVSVSCVAASGTEGLGT